MKMFTLTKDSLPTESGYYVVILDYGPIKTLLYSAKHRAFNVGDTNSTKEKEWFEITVKAWCKLEDFMKEIGYEED